MKLHLPSVLLTVGVLGLVALLSSQALTPVGGFRIEYLAHPRDYVQLKEGTPYTVPAGRVLVVTAMGHATGFTNSPSFNARLTINGQAEATAYYPLSVSPAPTVLALPNGLTAKAGDIVEISTPPPASPSGESRAWGYLASQ